MRQPLVAVEHRRTLAFRAAVEFPHHTRAEPADEGFLQPHGTGRGEMPQRAQGTHIMGSACCNG